MHVASDELPATRFRLVLEAQDDEDKPADLVGRRVYFTLELLESVRAVVNEYLASNDHLEYAAPATMERLRVESPQDLIANVPAIVGSISLMCLGILGPIRVYQSIRLKKADVDTRQQDARVRRAEADVAEAKAALEVEIYQTLRGSLGEGQTTDRLLALTRQQLLPVVESLAAQEIQGAHQAELPDRAT